MALVPHKITALNELNEGAKNTIAGAVVSLFDTDGNAVTLFDDESGSNGSTTKQTDAEGVVVVYVTAGEYDEQVNGGIQRRVTVGGNWVISYADTTALENSRPNKTGQRAENRERASAQYVLSPSGYVALPGDITAANGRVWRVVREHITTDRTYNIPTEFATLQDGVDFILSGLTSSPEVRFSLNIESGHQPSSGIVVKNVDCRNINITSDDATVTLSNGFSGGSVDTTADNCFICGDSATLPTLDCLVDANDQCNAGYYAYNNSTGFVEGGCGVINCYEFGLYCSNSSNITAQGSNFSGAGRGSRFTTNSRGHIQGINLSGVRGTFPLSGGASYFSLDVSRGSVVNVMSQASAGSVSDLSNSAGKGISARRSLVSASGVNVSGATEDGIRAEVGATIIATSSNISGCGRAILCAGAGSNVNASGSTSDLTGSTGSNAVQVADCGVVSLNEANLSDASGDGISASSGSVVNASEATISNCGGNGIVASDGAQVNASVSTIANNGIRGVSINGGATCNVRGSTVSGNATEDLRASRGSTISANDCTTTNGSGSPSTSDTNFGAFNSPNSNGIIYA